MGSSKKLRRYQAEGVDFLRSRRVAILGDEMGLGKSRQAIIAAKLPALVICPAGLRINWRREIDAWAPGRSWKFVIACYTDRYLDTWIPESFHSLIVDEAHYIKNPESRRSKTICRLIRQFTDAGKQVFALSGTLVPNRPIELWPLLYGMRITPRKWTDFAMHYARGHHDAQGRFDVSGASHLPELRAILAPHYLRRTKAEVLDELPAKQWRVIALGLPVPERVKDYDLDNMKRLPESVAFEAMSDLLHQHGLRKVEAAARHVRDLLEGGVGKVLVFAYHRDVLEALYEEFARNHGVQIIHGGLNASERQQAVDAFQDLPGVRILLGQVQAAGVGYNLTAADHVVFVEASWVPAVLDQAADRAHRLGTKKHVVVDLLTIHRSIDEHMLRRTLEKRRVIEQVLPFTPVSQKGRVLNSDGISHEQTLRPVPSGEAAGEVRGQPPDAAGQEELLPGLREGAQGGLEAPSAEGAPEAELVDFSTHPGPGCHVQPDSKNSVGGSHVSEPTPTERMQAAVAEFAQAIVDIVGQALRMPVASNGAAEPEKPKPRRRGRPPKAKPAALELKADDVRKALKVVIAEYGPEGASQVLEPFEAKNVSQLDPSKYAEVIKAAEEYVAS